MATVVAPRPSPLTRARIPALRLGMVAAWLLPFALITYLGLEGGGYDPIVQGEVGIAIWWIVLMGALAGLLASAGLGRLAWAGLALLGAFTLWTALGIGWAESAGVAWIVLAHVATLMGALLLLLAAQARGAATRSFLNGLTVAVGLVGVLAVLSRLKPQWFPANETAEFLPATHARLSYPLNYWNALGAFLAIGFPLLTRVASAARTRVAQAAAAGVLPAMVLALYFTGSRGGAGAAIAGLILFIVLTPDRVAAFSSLVLAGGGAAVLIASAAHRTALQDGLTGAAARDQGDELLVLLLVVCAGVGLLRFVLGLALEWRSLPRPSASVRRVALAALLAGFLLGGATLVATSSAEISSRWDRFKNPSLGVDRSDVNRPARFTSASGNGRYQYWRSALNAFDSAPLHGIGPGSYELWWTRKATLGGKIRRAHSLPFQTLAELGVVGVALLGGFLALVLGAGVVRSLRGRDRQVIAAATAGCAAFVAAAAVDWTWEVTVVPVAFLALAAVILAGRRPARGARVTRRSRIAGGAVVAVSAVAALIAIALPLASTSSIRDSQRHFRAGRLSSALQDARTAERVLPSAAAPHLQEAFVLERAGRLGAAARAARTAVSKEPTYWIDWLVLSRIEAKRGLAKQGIRAYLRAKALNPKWGLFSG